MVVTENGLSGYPLHMNGRMYDATIGRFISADPHIQAGSLSQSYNRYSYVLNNPMKYTDPSGYFFKKAFKKIKKSLKRAFKKPWVRALAGIAAGFFTAGAVVGWASKGAWGSMLAAGKAAAAGTSGALGALMAGGAAGGFMGGLVGSGGDWKAALVGGLTGAAAAWVGAQSWNVLSKGVAHGFVGGSTTVMQGGQFGHGFASSFFTKMVSDPIQGIAENVKASKEIVGATMAALVGGTASSIGGGKFSNGAQTAAIQYLFNQAASKRRLARNGNGNSLYRDVDRGLVDGFKSIFSGVGKSFRYLGRSFGFYGESEFYDARSEGHLMDKAISSAFVYAANDPDGAMNAITTTGNHMYELATDAANAYTVSRTISRLATGIVLAPLGALAGVGDITSGIENGRTSFIEHTRSAIYGSQ